MYMHLVLICHWKTQTTTVKLSNTTPDSLGNTSDKETNLHYNYFRYYEPETGRYISPDPIGLAGGLNVYGYAEQNPASLIDSLGLAAETPIDLISLGLSIREFNNNPNFLNGVGVAIDGTGALVPFLPAGVGIIRQCNNIFDTTKGVPKPLKDQAAELILKNANRHRITLRSPSQKIELDLAGRPHDGVPTPHIRISPRNLNAPNQPAYNTKNSSIYPVTQQDIRTVRRFLERQERQ
ncbi:MAG TPA: RHS repeat-associated core domain-containing protein [Nitrosomonas sp.]|nr:RHS repeat-associated core domain-containing protein [Nitrosomonas sp.]